jgi:uncharacterized membrane protein YhhN
VKRSQLFLIGFGVAVVGEMVSIVLNLSAHYFFKPSIMLTLIGFYFSMAKTRSATLVAALFLCWAGDVLLMFAPGSELYFILGLIAFLIGHLFYIFCFRQIVWAQPGNLLATQKVRLIFPILLAGTGLMVIVFPTLGSMKIPVFIYSTVLMLMVSFAVLRLGRTNQASFNWVLFGALLFMISDSILAINKFYSSFHWASVAIMATYILAQFAIVKGLLLHRPQE